MITKSLYVASVVKVVIQESTALRLNNVFEHKSVICVHNAGFSLFASHSDGNFWKLKCKGL